MKYKYNDLGPRISQIKDLLSIKIPINIQHGKEPSLKENELNVFCFCRSPWDQSVKEGK